VNHYFILQNNIIVLPNDIVVSSTMIFSFGIVPIYYHMVDGFEIQLYLRFCLGWYFYNFPGLFFMVGAKKVSGSWCWCSSSSNIIMIDHFGWFQMPPMYICRCSTPCYQYIVVHSITNIIIAMYLVQSDVSPSLLNI